MKLEARDRLLKQFESAAAQYTSTLNAADRVRLQQQMDDLEKQIGALDQSLLASGFPDQASNARRYWETYLPEIDFAEVERIVKELLGRFEAARGGAALFLLQNAGVMAGDLCAERVRRLANRTADWKHYPISFAAGDRVNEWTLLRRMGDYVGSEAPGGEGGQGGDSHLAGYAQAIRQKIVGSLQSGSVVFIELNTWDPLGLQSHLMSWFVRDFWHPLVQELPAIAQRHPFVKLIAVIIAQTPLSTDRVPADLWCSCEQFSGERILELPLRAWTPEEIRDWLLHYAGLTGDPPGWEALRVEEMAQLIHLASGGGQPELVQRKLLQQLEQIYGRVQEEQA